METSKILISCMRLLTLGILIGFGPTVLGAGKIEKIVSTGVERNEAGKASQKAIDKISVSTDKIASKFKRELKVIDGLKIYNALLQKQLNDQQAEINQLKDSIEEVSIIERQMTPLMLRMLSGLEQFIALDVPFLIEKRNKRVNKLKKLLSKADVTAAEKFRVVLEAFEIENEFGRTIEAYVGNIEVSGQSKEVSFLRIGRVALLYQSPGGEYNGIWDQSNRTWVTLKAEEYRNHIAKGLKMARKQNAPDLLMIPVSAAGGA